MESVGFKEWALVCEAIGRGEQSLIVRKGGIHEGRAGFAFTHAEFFLFPTFFHAQVERIRGAERSVPPQRPGEIEIRFFAKLEFSAVIASWETAEALEPFHIWTPEIVRERFEYDDAPGIHVAFVRAFCLSQPWIIPDLPAYGGCRSWVKLPELPPEISTSPVLSEDEHQQRSANLRAILSAAPVLGRTGC
ncbi:MAG TPA: DUF1802 family protein [Chthoniobacterales bacterium]|jgi:hypothetical protein